MFISTTVGLIKILLKRKMRSAFYLLKSLMIYFSVNKGLDYNYALKKGPNPAKARISSHLIFKNQLTFPAYFIKLFII